MRNTRPANHKNITANPSSALLKMSILNRRWPKTEIVAITCKTKSKLSTVITH